MSDFNPEDPTTGQDAAMRWASGSAESPSPNVQATMHQMTEQLQTVIDAAERAAEAIRYDAEEQARRHLAEAQRKADRLTAERVGLISELTDDLVRHAANVRDHSEQMVRALEDAIHSVTDKLEQPAMAGPYSSEESAIPAVPSPSLGDSAVRSEAPVPRDTYTEFAWEPPQTGTEAPVPPPAHNAASPLHGPQADLAVSQDALIYATRLIVDGEDRDSVTRVLREQFGVAEPDLVVDRVLGIS